MLNNMTESFLINKLPPSSSAKRTQETRRSKALEDQKRRRAQKFDATRQLDVFASLNLNDDSEDDDIAEDDEQASGAPDAVVNDTEIHDDGVEDAPSGSVPSEIAPGKRKRRKKGKKKNSNYNKPSKWADQCMYAELLEMTADDNLWESDDDTLPSDLETSWVAVAPIPVGKRCLVVTHQSPGLGGVPNTTLRSRLLGKALIPRFPSPLPALTVLDCILDANWRDNGIIHVLDVIRWKGQDVGDCEAPFRFWWRDTRLSEVSQSLPPNINFRKAKQGDHLQFPYPTYFMPIPYHADTSLTSLDRDVIPAARSVRSITVGMPSTIPSAPEIGQEEVFSFSMEVEMPLKPAGSSSSPFVFASSSPPSVSLSPTSAIVQSDGLLLYVSESSYEPGTSPLSSWVPLSLGGNQETEPTHSSGQLDEGPLELFHRLVKRRLNRARMQTSESTGDVSMDL
ncbi:hypothetical protein BKA70DRAFT_1158969 [Coprinopsis sp. MPI-PUGE-AT-0042]|nr:hypothetical protein BKA70DRAFT_1158969 [Coprinopsis sp. MPI-PUGE-AT-0042]